MSLQLPFFLTLYGAGLVFGLLLARDLLVLFLTITAWLWSVASNRNTMR